MTHPSSGRRGLSRDKTYHRLFHVRLDEIRRGFFGVAADFSDHDYGFGLRIAIEEIECVDKIRADDGIAADPDCRRLSDAALRKLMHGLVSQRAGARDDPHVSFLVN